jgi:crossover junction endodeoxyribonuclease RuvC
VIIVGLDLSLTSTGIAILNTGTRKAHVDRIQSDPPKTERHPKTRKPLPPTLLQRTERLGKLRDQICATAEDADLIVIEGPSFASKTGSAHDRSGLWWLVVHTLDDYRWAPIIEVPPSCRMKYATGKGNAPKDVVLAAVVRRYLDVDVTGNDEADALILAAMGARHLGAPIEDTLPQLNLTAMDNVHWPAPKEGAE